MCNTYFFESNCVVKDLFIFSSVGSNLPYSYKEKVFDSWNTKESDSGCVVYNDDGFEYNKYFKTVLNNKNFKFPNLFYYLSIQQNIVHEYKYIAVLDDDLLLEDNISKITHIMDTHDLTICSPCNRCVSKRSGHSIMNVEEKENKLLITNFCEMGAMIIESSFLKQIKNKEKKVEDYGYDYYISNIASKNNKKIGIVSTIGYDNPEQQQRNIAWHTYNNNKDDLLLQKIEPLILCVIDL